MTAGPKTPFLSGLAASLPIALGYAPIAFSFGIAATHVGLSLAQAAGMSLIVYSGAAQFMALAIIAAGASLPVAVLTLVLINLRHLIYGPTLMRAARPKAPLKMAWLWSFGLTDEVFAAALAAFSRGGVRFSEPYMLGLGLGAYSSWVGGTVLGGLAGAGALDGFPALAAGLGFMLTALFLALLLAILSPRQIPVIVVAAVVTVILMLAVSTAAGIVGGMLAGALAGMLLPDASAGSADLQEAERTDAV